jgi:broad-specificity NMP kinase
MYSIRIFFSICNFSVRSIVINLIGGPGCGKSIMAMQLFIKLKILGYSVEYVSEYAKKLTWTKNYDGLNNQYMLTKISTICRKR